MRSETAAIFALSMAVVLSGCNRTSPKADTAGTAQQPAPATAPKTIPNPVSAGMACNIDQQFYGGKAAPMGPEVSLAHDQYLAGAGWVIDPQTGMPPDKVTIALTTPQADAAMPTTSVEVDTGVARPGVLQTIKSASADAKPGFMFRIPKNKLPQGSYVLRITDGSGKPLCDRTWSVQSL